MRFVHKKIPKSLAFLHILFAALHRRLEFDLPDRHLVSRLKLSGDYKNLQIYGITCMSRCTIGREGRSIRQPCAKVKRILPLSCVLGLAAPQHRNFCTAESKLYSFQR